jgi:membrane associated rhomboid family serine protease
LGSSGAVFSVVAASVLINWKIKLWSIRLRNLLFISLILYEVFLTFSNPDSEVGHLAHVFGSIFGVIYFFKYIKNKS